MFLFEKNGRYFFIREFSLLELELISKNNTEKNMMNESTMCK